MKRKQFQLMCAYVNSSLLGCYGVYKAAIFEPLDPDINALHSSEMSVITYQSTLCNITRDLNRQRYRHEHPRSRPCVAVNTDAQAISGFLIIHGSYFCCIQHVRVFICLKPVGVFCLLSFILTSQWSVSSLRSCRYVFLNTQFN